MNATVLKRPSTGIAAIALVAGVLSGVTAWEYWPARTAEPAVAATPRVPEWFQPIQKAYPDTALEPDFDFASLYGAGPAWFGPIAKAYGYHAGVTPNFDFASLYSGSGASQLEPRGQR